MNQETQTHRTARVTFRYGMVLNPSSLDAAWRRRKFGRALENQLKGMVIGAAGMLLVVYIFYWLVKP